MSPENMQKILDRLDAIEKQNQELLQEVESLREQLKQQNAPQQQAATEQTIDERRIRELAQTKVEASAKFPVELTGMALFNVSGVRESRNALFQNFYSDYSLGIPGANATFNQSIVGLRFNGPQLPGGGHASGFLSMDFYADADEYQTFRLRRAGVTFDWRARSISFLKDKPLIAPLEPLSYARIGVPPLAGAGNLWLWLPQVRYDERFKLPSGLDATVSAAVLETDENYGATATVSENRPALQSRFEVKKALGERTAWSAGIAAHFSESHLLGGSVASRVVSADGRFAPVRWLEVSGTILTGQNFANLGGIGPGAQRIGTVLVPVHGSAGWAQLSFPVTSRLTFDIYSGRQVNRGRDLTAYQIARTFDIAGNILYRLAPNIVLGVEAARDNAEYLKGTEVIGNRIDATVAYLF